MVRVFIAIRPALALQQAFHDVQACFRQLPMSLRWVKPEDVHLTLKFLGDVPADRLAAIGQAMAQTATGQPLFTVRAQHLGCFPNPSRPRILWMGLDDPERILTQLQQRLENALVCMGFPGEERPFRPHMTLARIPQVRDRGRFLSLLQAFHDRQFGQFAVAQLHLFESQLRPTGALYTVRHTVAFAG